MANEYYVKYEQQKTISEKVQELFEGKANLQHTHQTSDITGLDTALGGKANATHTHVCTDITDLETKLNEYAKKSDITTVYRYKGSCTWAELIAKTDAVVGDTWNVTDKDGMNYTCKTAGTAGADAWDANGTMTTVNLDGYYTIEQIQSNYYDKTTIDSKLGSKADKGTTLASYGITDSYTKTEVDGKIPSPMTAEMLNEILAILEG